MQGVKRNLGPRFVDEKTRFMALHCGHQARRAGIRRFRELQAKRMNRKIFSVDESAPRHGAASVGRVGKSPATGLYRGFAPPDQRP